MLKKLEELLSRTDRSILFVGIGNVLRKDDGAGVYISNRIRKGGNVDTLTVEASIENYIGKINSLNPGILVLIDCMDTGAAPGSAILLPVEQVMDITFNTHNIRYLMRIRHYAGGSMPYGCHSKCPGSYH